MSMLIYLIYVDLYSFMLLCTWFYVELYVIYVDLYLIYVDLYLIYVDVYLIYVDLYMSDVDNLDWSKCWLYIDLCWFVFDLCWLISIYIFMLISIDLLWFIALPDRCRGEFTGTPLSFPMLEKFVLVDPWFSLALSDASILSRVFVGDISIVNG